MSVDTELNAWRQEWQAAQTELPDLRSQVQRGTRRLRAMAIADLLVTILAGGITTGWAIRSHEPDAAVLAGMTWVFIAAAWTFGLINRRGCWSPAALTTEAFLDLSIQRCRRALNSVKFGLALALTEIVLCLAWVYHHLSARASLPLAEFSTSVPVLLSGAASVVFLVGILLYRQRKQRELHSLLALRQFSNSETFPA